jgi:hypothetical protein
MTESQDGGAGRGSPEARPLGDAAQSVTHLDVLACAIASQGCLIQPQRSGQPHTDNKGVDAPILEKTCLFDKSAEFGSGEPVKTLASLARDAAPFGRACNVFSAMFRVPDASSRLTCRLFAGPCRALRTFRRQPLVCVCMCVSPVANHSPSRVGGSRARSRPAR